MSVAFMMETWPVPQYGNRRGARLVAAFAVSLLCHTLVLFAAPGWQVEPRPSSPLVVTVVERGGGGGDAGGAGASAIAPPPSGELPPASDVTNVAPPRVMPRERAPIRRVATAPVPTAARRFATAAAPTTARDAVPSTTSPASAPVPPVASAGDGSVAGALADGDAGTGTGTGTGFGPSTGGAGSGTTAGGGGAGSDGLRVFCHHCPTPDYPGRARRQGWQGTVDVQLAIGRDGAVQVARVGRSSGYPALDEVALEAARASRFVVPRERDGLHGQLRYRFVLDTTAARR